MATITSVTNVKNGNFLNYSVYSGKGTPRSRGTVAIPPAPKMRTKGQCKLSQAELAGKIAELARASAAAGIDFRFPDSGHSAEFDKLNDDFTSLASPDRTKIINDGLNDFAEQIRTFDLSKQDLELSFFQLLFNNSDKFGSHVTVNLIEFCDEQGNPVAHYANNGGWFGIITPAECAQHNLFISLWDQALADARAELEEEPDQIPEEEMEMSFLA